MSAQKTTTVLPVVNVVNNQPVTTSKNVAEAFGKRHTHVLDAIKNINVPEGFSCEPIFRRTSQKVPQPQGGFREDPLYEMTRDGFVFLVMGFTGAKAIKFKLLYIDAFNRMEEALKAKALPPAADLPFTLDQPEKRCSLCRQAKPLSEFNRDLATADGVACYCRTCARIKQREHKARNRERNLAVIQPRKPVAAGEAIASEKERRLRREVLNLVPPVAGLMRQCLKVAKTLPAGPLCDELLDSVEKCVLVQEMIMHVLNDAATPPEPELDRRLLS